MSEIDLAAIKARCDRATDGPWNVRELPLDYAEVSDRDSNTVADAWHINDAYFIANARTDVPALVAEVERLRAEVERLTNER